MATTVMDTAITLTDTGMPLLTPMDITATTARDLLMPSPPTGTTVMGTEATVEDTEAMVLVTATDTTVEKSQ